MTVDRDRKAMIEGMAEILWWAANHVDVVRAVAGGKRYRRAASAEYIPDESARKCATELYEAWRLPPGAFAGADTPPKELGRRFAEGALGLQGEKKDVSISVYLDKDDGELVWEIESCTVESDAAPVERTMPGMHGHRARTTRKNPDVDEDAAVLAITSLEPVLAKIKRGQVDGHPVDSVAAFLPETGGPVYWSQLSDANRRMKMGISDRYLRAVFDEACVMEPRRFIDGGPRENPGPVNPPPILDNEFVPLRVDRGQPETWEARIDDWWYYLTATRGGQWYWTVSNRRGDYDTEQSGRYDTREAAMEGARGYARARHAGW